MTAQQRMANGRHLNTLNSFLGLTAGEQIRLQELTEPQPGTFRLPERATDAIAAKLAPLAANQLSAEQVKLTRRVQLALAHFGVKVPEGRGGPGSADDALTGGKGDL